MSNLDQWVQLPKSWREAAWSRPGAVLLESTLPSLHQHRSFLFSEPLRYLTVYNVEELPGFFRAVQQALEQDLYLAGYLTYELGAGLQGIPTRALPSGACLAKFGVYRPPRVFNHFDADAVVEPVRVTDQADPLPIAMLPVLSPEDYVERIAHVQAWIARGDTYQVNFTTSVQSRFYGHGLHAYDRLALQQPCSYSALVHMDDDRKLLSFSPELFFQTSETGRIVTRPMKGTAPRGTHKGADEQAATDLRRDEKNRAEHVMIVDLLRNDLGRICETGSVRVDDLFHVEPYPTVHQMVSTVSGQLQPGIRWKEIFTSLFPSGSITGAPKRRTMELIRKLEGKPRGVYTGAIGYIAPSGASAFSVAIRTLVLQETAHGTVATMGVGGGIVADSIAKQEWQECLLKTSFLHRASVDLKLIETMVAHGDTVPRLALHLQRLARSAWALGFLVDARKVMHAIAESLSSKDNSSQRIRVTVSRNGKVEAISEVLQPWPSSLRVRISTQRTDRNDPSLQHKTTFRRVYDDAFAAAKRDGFDEAIFLNGEDELTEGCVTNLVVAGKQGLQTPSPTCGVLPGIYRGSLVESGLVQEAVVRSNDLTGADAVFLCNSVRGLVPVRSILLESGKPLSFDEATACGLRDAVIRSLAKSQAET